MRHTYSITLGMGVYGLIGFPVIRSGFVNLALMGASDTTSMYHVIRGTTPLHPQLSEVVRHMKTNYVCPGHHEPPDPWH
jgi:hypothetical protein